MEKFITRMVGDGLKKCLLLVSVMLHPLIIDSQQLEINPEGYFDRPGLNVMVFQDRYPEGHQGGITIIQNGTRVAANGDLRLEPTPGQWQPIPKMGKPETDRDKGEISIRCSYPDSSLNARGFNPILYPDLYFTYRVRVMAEGTKIRIVVDLDELLPGNWDRKVGFNLELFPGLLFGKSWYMDGTPGNFPTQPNGPMRKDVEGKWQAYPLASGKRLTVAPDSPEQLIIIESLGEDIALLDGRFNHNNGWFTVRSMVTPGKTKRAVEWIVDVRARENFRSAPVIHVNQVGYHPGQQKMALIELDKNETIKGPVSLVRFSENGEEESIKTEAPEDRGNYLRYHCYRFDFSEVTTGGVYQVRYGESFSGPFRIASDIYSRHVWQPTLEYFLPVQMCHMRVNEGYRVWHGLCHMDDALMAPVNVNHFDGYLQGPSTLTRFKPYEPVPGLNCGGWHDAGDYDLRVESQAGTVWALSLSYELFRKDWDQTSIDQAKRLVEIHLPDGRPDILQQVEHGLITILAGYQSLGRLYRGIICPDLRQYVLLGDASTMTDNQVYKDGAEPTDDRIVSTEAFPEMRATPTDRLGDKGNPGPRDDRLVFTEEDPERELSVVEGLAAAARVMRGYNDTLAAMSESVAEALYDGIDLERIEGEIGQESRVVHGLYGIYTDPHYLSRIRHGKIRAAAELLLTTNQRRYLEDIIRQVDETALNDSETLAFLGRIIHSIDDRKLKSRITTAAKAYKAEVDRMLAEAPYGIPFPDRMSHGWSIQRFGVQQYFLHSAFPEIFDATGMFNALNFILGIHPGEHTASYVSGVGTRSATVAYGFNRADWSFIPGGSIKGTGIIQPDFPELKVWPFLWQQAEYVIGGGATHFMFLVLAAEDLLE